MSSLNPSAESFVPSPRMEEPGSFKLNPEATVFTPGCSVSDSGMQVNYDEVQTADTAYAHTEGYQGDQCHSTRKSGHIVMDFNDYVPEAPQSEVIAAKKKSTKGSVWTDRALRSCDKLDKKQDEEEKEAIETEEKETVESKGFSFNPNAKSFDFDPNKQPPATTTAMMVNVPFPQQTHNSAVQGQLQMTKIATPQSGNRRNVNVRNPRYHDESKVYNEENKRHYDRRNDNNHHQYHSKRDHYSREPRYTYHSGPHGAHSNQTHQPEVMADAVEITVITPPAEVSVKEPEPTEPGKEESEPKKLSYAAMVARPRPKAKEPTPASQPTPTEPPATEEKSDDRDAPSVKEEAVPAVTPWKTVRSKAAGRAPIRNATIVPAVVPRVESQWGPKKVADAPIQPEASTAPTQEAVAAPKETVASTDTAAKQETEARPKQETATIKEIAAPKLEIVAPKQEIVASKQEIVAPKQEIAVPKQEIAVPKQATAPKQEVAAAPKQDIVVAQKQETTMPQAQPRLKIPKQEFAYHPRVYKHEGVPTVHSKTCKQEAVPTPTAEDFPAFPSHCNTNAPKSEDVPTGQSWAARARRVAEVVPKRLAKAAGGKTSVDSVEKRVTLVSVSDKEELKVTVSTEEQVLSEQISVEEKQAIDFSARETEQISANVSEGETEQISANVSEGEVEQISANVSEGEVEKQISTEKPSEEVEMSPEKQADFSEGETEDAETAEEDEKDTADEKKRDVASLETTRDTESKREDDVVSTVEDKDETPKAIHSGSGKAVEEVLVRDSWDDDDTATGEKIPVVEEGSSPYTASPSTDDSLSEDSFGGSITRFEREFLYSMRYATQCLGPCPPDVPEYLRIGYEDKNAKKKNAKNKTNEPAPKLARSESAWGPRRQEEVDDTTKFTRKIKGLLNKLTVEKYDALLPQILESGITMDEHVQILMTEVFEKATTQHHFICMYTNLCTHLNDHLNENNISQGSNNFRRILLLECEQSFRTNMEPLQIKPEEDEIEAQQKHKARMLGNMKFIGQLFIQKMLQKRLIFSCTRELLEKRTEDTLETLCAFMLEIGPKFDNQNFEPYAKNFEEVFHTMKIMQEDPASNLKTRTRCLIKDVLDMRKTKWQGRLLKQQSRPPTMLEEVKKEWQDENKTSDQTDVSSSKHSWNHRSGETNLQKSYSDLNLQKSGKTKSSSTSKPSYVSQPSGLTNKSFLSSASTTPLRKKLGVNDSSISRSESSQALSLTAAPTECLRPGGHLSVDRKKKESVSLTSESFGPSRFMSRSMSKKEVESPSTSGVSHVEAGGLPDESTIAVPSQESEKPILASLGVPDSVSQTPTPSSASSEGIRSYASRRSRASELCVSSMSHSEKSMRNREPIQLSEPSKSSWAATRRDKVSEDVKFIGKMKSILNKLTIEKYDSLYKQLQDLEFRKISQIRALTDDLFCKATTQHHFIEMYTKLCEEFNKWWLAEGQDSCEIDIVEEEPKRADGRKTNHFKSVLLNKCQDVFEHLNEKPVGVEEIENEEQRLEAQVKLKERMLGNVKFIGQLLIHKLLGSRILVRCANTLLEIQSAESLETLAAFLQTVGPVFDAKDFKQTKELHKIFDDVRKLVEEKKVSTRINALLSNVLDRRASKWSRNKNENGGPQSLTEVKMQWVHDHKIKTIKEDTKHDGPDDWQQAKGKRSTTSSRFRR